MTYYTSFDALRGSAQSQGVSVMPRGVKGKMMVMSGGKSIRSRQYERASQDASGQESSVSTQRRRNDSKRIENGWTSAGAYTDNDKPASRKARKPGSRPDYERMLEDIRRDPCDVLILFEMARGQRDLAVYVAIRDLCLENGPFFWMVGDNLYDLRDKNDKQQLNAMASKAEGGSDDISEAVSAGLESQAQEGRPHGPIPFGYIRLKNPHTGKFDSQIIDDVPRGSWNAADVVRGIFADYLAGVPVYAICEQLNEKGVPAPRLFGAIRRGDTEKAARWAHTRWDESPVYNILRNAAYIGVRIHKKVMTKEQCWDALIDEDTFFKAARKMERQSFTGERPSAAQTLLTCLAMCQCGKEMTHQRFDGSGSNRAPTYRCRRGDSTVPQVDAEEYVETIFLAFVANPATAERLAVDTSVDTARAKDRAAKLRAKLAWWKERMEDEERPDVSEEDYDRHAAKLLPQIREAELDADRAGAPGVRSLLGADAVAKWEAFLLPRKREILREAATITVHPCGRGNRNARIEDRVTIDLERVFRT